MLEGYGNADQHTDTGLGGVEETTGSGMAESLRDEPETTPETEPAVVPAAEPADAPSAACANGSAAKPAAIVIGAGFSTLEGGSDAQMQGLAQDFDPLMDVNGFPMIRMTVQSLIDAGASPVCVVLGRGTEDVRAALEMDDVIIAEAVGSEEFGMLEQVKLGLQTLQRDAPDATGFYLIPCDMPLVRPSTIAGVGASLQPGDDAAMAMYGGDGTYPVFVSRSCFPTISGFSGEGGLQALLCDMHVRNVEVDDPGSVAHAARNEDIDAVLEMARATKGISEKRCIELYEEAGTPQNVREHCATVAMLSKRVATNLNAAGYHLDTELCYSGGMLHDVKRVEPVHSRKGAWFLRERGYSALADIVLEHDFFLGVCPADFDEANVVCFADKLAKNDTVVTVEQRYRDAIARSVDEPHVHDLFSLDKELFEHYQAIYERLTGDVII